MKKLINKLHLIVGLELGKESTFTFDPATAQLLDAKRYDQLTFSQRFWKSDYERHTGRILGFREVSGASGGSHGRQFAHHGFSDLGGPTPKRPTSSKNDQAERVHDKTNRSLSARANQTGVPVGSASVGL